MSDYILGDFERERERLQRIAAIHDPVTFRHLESIGVAPGWHCAEVGGGAGTVARWLADRVGAAGRVVATDIDTQFLDALRFDHLEVRRSDIAVDPIATGEFDLVHTRLVLMHVRDRAKAIAHMVEAVRPGGWLLIEEPDFSVMRETHPASPAVQTVMNAVLEAFRAAGADARYGLSVPAALQRAGATSIVSEGELSLLQFGTPGAEALALLFENVGARLVQRGLIDEEALVRAISTVRSDTAVVMCTPLILSTRARRPEQAQGTGR